MYVTKEKGSRLINFVLTRIPSCCSAGLLRSVQKVPGYTNKLEVTYTKEEKSKKAFDVKVARMIASGGFFTDKGIFLLCAWLLMWRVLNSKHPYKAFNCLDYHKSRMTKEPGAYFWPSKVWTIFDRTDLSPDISMSNSLGKYFKEHEKQMGLTVTVVNGPSVHAKEKSYSTFGSDKPNGYGNIAVYNIIIDDIDQFKKYVEGEINTFIDDVTFVKGTTKSTATEAYYALGA